MAPEPGQATRAGCSVSGPAAAEGPRAAPELEAAEQRQGRGEATTGGMARRAAVLLTKPHQTGSAPSNKGSGVEDGGNSPRSQRYLVSVGEGHKSSRTAKPL